MASTDDVLTAVKNIVIALNNANAFYRQNHPQLSQYGLSANTVVTATPGRVYSVNVTTAGATAGAIYDTNTIASIGASNLIISVPATVATITLNWPLKTGLVYIPGSGQVASIAYS